MLKMNNQLSFDVKNVNEIKAKYEPTEIDSLQIGSPRDAVTFLEDIWNEYRYLKESFYVLLLNNAKYVIGYSIVSMGGLTATIVDPADVLRLALLTPCKSMILAHNHPSGNIKEFKADIQLTKRIADSAKTLGLNVDDHIILAGEGKYTSFREKGLLN